MDTNDELYEDALDSVEKLFNDGTVGKEKTKENLECLRDEIDTMLNVLTYEPE
jgi:hypothetical protein